MSDEIKNENEMTEEIKEDIALVDDEVEGVCSDCGHEKECFESDNNSQCQGYEKKEENVEESLSKLVNSITDAVKNVKINKTTEAPAKKPFKIGFWGYLTAGLVIKGVVEIVKAVSYNRTRR